LAWCDLVYLLTNVIIDAVGGISYCSWNWWIRWKAIINGQFLYDVVCSQCSTFQQYINECLDSE